MNKKETKIPATTVRKLISSAKKAMKLAHSPYSKYKVGAALLCEDGRIYTGCNVENASYGLTVCAERTAILKAVSEGRKKFTAIAVTAGGKAIPYPCGACRQAMSEFCGSGFIIIVAGQSGGKDIFTLGGMLPNSFGL